MHEPHWCDYFSGSVATGDYFRMTLSELRRLLDRVDPEEDPLGTVVDLVFVGLCSYFEAFCRDYFACLVNIEPTLVNNLKSRGQPVAVDASHVLLYSGQVVGRLGFILAEGYDFGTPRKVNALYGALLGVTPFSKDEAKRYEGMLQDRNLLVHHRGTYTLSYLRQTCASASEMAEAGAFHHSRTIGRHDVLSAIEFVEEVAYKMVQTCSSRLVAYVNSSGLTYSAERQRALAEAGRWQ